MNETWVFPGNPKFFDIEGFLKNNGFIIWKRKANMSTNDLVYLYLSSPRSQIKFKCKIVDPDVSDEVINENQYALPQNGRKSDFKYVKLIPLVEYKDGTFPWPELKKNGLGQVQIQVRAERKLLNYIASKESEGIEREFV